MAGKARQQPATVAGNTALPAALVRQPRRYDWFAALLQMEAAHPGVRRVGEMGRPADEYIRLGQRPTVQFVSQAIAGIEKSRNPEGGVPWLQQYFFGVFGPNGPLPLHLTEYAVERERYHGDPVFPRFVNLFHHRMLGLFYRNWRMARPVTDFYGVHGGGFKTRLRQMTGIPPSTEAGAGMESVQQAFTGLMAAGTRNTESLVRVLEHFTGAPVRIFALTPSWLVKDENQHSRLGCRLSALGRDLQLGGRVLTVQSSVHIEVGPLSPQAYNDLLPKAPGGAMLCTMVYKMLGCSINASVRLMAEKGHESHLGRMQLGYDSWLGREKSSAVRPGCTLYPGRVISSG